MSDYETHRYPRQYEEFNTLIYRSPDAYRSRTDVEAWVRRGDMSGKLVLFNQDGWQVRLH